MFTDYIAGNCIKEDAPVWNTLNDTLREKYQSRLTIVAWIHSHVGRNTYECNFSRIDMHTQKAWSNTYPDILGLVVHVGDDKSIMNYDFYAITKDGYEKFIKSKGMYTNPEKESNYTSCLNLVKFTEDTLEVLEIEVDDPREEEPITKKPKLISAEYEFTNNKTISSIDFSCKHQTKSTKIIVKVMKQISLDSYLIGDYTDTCKLKLDSNFILLEEGKSYKILFKDTIHEEKCIVVTEKTDVSELYNADANVPYDVAMKIDKRVITPKVFF